MTKKPFTILLIEKMTLLKCFKRALKEICYNKPSEEQNECLHLIKNLKAG